MISRSRPGAWLALFTVCTIPMLGCQRVPLLAPSGSTITLTTSTTALPVNGTTQVVAQVLEPAGTPPHSGTHITFTTTLGTMQPSEVETDINGQATATFSAGVASGTATITAISGGANVGTNGALKILVGTAAVGKVIVNASPGLVPALGGSSTITAVVLDVNGNPLISAPVSFSTTAGVLSSTIATTDKTGSAQTVLTTSTSATVTASVGATAPTTPPATGTPSTTPTSGQASGTVTVGILSAPTLVITPPATAPTVGFPASFTFAVTVPATNGSAVKDVTVSWGDGSTQDLGIVTGSAIVSHIYRSAGVFVVTATLTDASGNTVPVTTTVSVTTPALGLVITPPTTTPSAGLPASFTFAPTVPTGDAVRDVTVDWNDGGAPQDLGGITGSAVVTHVYANPASYAIRATLTDTFGNTITVVAPVTVITAASPTVIITPTVPLTHSATMTVSFQIQVSVPNGVGVQDVTIDFGDMSTSDLGGLNGTVTITHQYTVASGTPENISVTVKDTLGRTTVGKTSIVLP